jgi:hypothetical protein
VRFVAKSGPRISAAFETNPIVSSVAHYQLRVLDACGERRAICVSGYGRYGILRAHSGGRASELLEHSEQRRPPTRSDSPLSLIESFGAPVDR